MNQDSKLKQNFIYNLIYQILLVILPLITVPYVSRILGTEGVGIFSFTYSIVYYFMLIGMLGINNYGNRVVAKTRENKEELSKNFIGIYIIQFIVTTIMIIIYMIYTIFFSEYRQISIIQSIYLVSVLFDINWLFFGMENFKVTVSRNIIVKIISFISIFVFIRTSNDLWKYTLIMSLSTLIGQIILIPFLKKEISIVKVNLQDITKHFKPCITLFIPVIAVSLYKIMDKTMLGLLANMDEVGLYEQAEKIVSIPMGIITALGTVMLPRISNLVSKGNKKDIYVYIEKSISFMMFLAFPICFGLITISGEFIPLFLGQAFQKSGNIVMFLSVTILFISLANIIRTQYLIPNERDKEYIISVVIGAIINLIFNVIFIPKYQSYGACYGTIAAEFSVMIYQLYMVRKELPIKKYIIDNMSFLFKAIIMFVIINLFQLFRIRSFERILIQIVIGCIIYFLLNVKYIMQALNLKTIKSREGAKYE